MLEKPMYDIGRQLIDEILLSRKEVMAKGIWPEKLYIDFDLFWIVVCKVGAGIIIGESCRFFGMDVVFKKDALEVE